MTKDSGLTCQKTPGLKWGRERPVVFSDHANRRTEWFSEVRAAAASRAALGYWDHLHCVTEPYGFGALVSKALPKLENTEES